MTTIKIKCDVQKPTSCDDCIFLGSYPELDYGESMGYDNEYCSLTNQDFGPSYEEHGMSKDCPIISFE